MTFGGLGGCLPLRLGRGDDAGVSAAAHARLCADVVAVRRTMPVASILVAVDAGASPPTARVVGYSGRNGAGLENAPSVFVEMPDVRVALYAAANELGRIVDLSRYCVSGFAAIQRYRLPDGTWHTQPTYYEVNDTSVRLSIAEIYPDYFSLDIYGADDPPTIGDYGGQLDKRDSTTEGGDSYARQWYDYLKVAQGSAYSISDASVRAWGLKAEARALGTMQRLTEMQAASASPGCADAKLPMWCALLGVQQAGREPSAVRAECELRGRAPQAPTHDYLISELQRILGRRADITGIAHSEGTMTSWPDVTYWPGVVNGPGALDMGDGVWSSSRGRLTLQVAPLGGVTPAELADVMGREVSAFLDRTLPAVATWAWDTAGGDGFILDTSPLDITAL